MLFPKIFTPTIAATLFVSAYAGPIDAPAQTAVQIISNTNALIAHLNDVTMTAEAIPIVDIIAAVFSVKNNIQVSQLSS
jgi:hypothetical protein